MNMTQPVLSGEDLKAYRAAQKKRNVWLALALAAFVVLVGVTSVIRIQSSDLSKSEGFYMSGALQKKTDAATRAPAPAEVPGQ